MSSPRQFVYDIFISYAHRDDHDRWVKHFVNAIIEEHARFTPVPLEIFFDSDEIRTMHDWEHRILRGLRGSKIMVAMLSPHYFDSAYCRKEWEIFLDHELDRAMPGHGIAPIYTVTAPGFEYDAGETLDEWLNNMRRRQFLDVRPWRPHGPQAIQQEDVRTRLELLDQQLTEKLRAAEQIATSPTNMPAHNRNFVGRIDELRRVREVLAMGRVGTVAALQGLGGIGKSSLAFEYAHAYASEYPGGRFYVAAAGVRDLRVPLINLAEQKGVPLTDDERRDIDTAFARVRAAFEQGERSLLMLDNVDDAALLSPAQRAQCLPNSDNVHIMLTTRLEAKKLAGVEYVSLDSLSERDALQLLERHRPFDDEDEQEAARLIVRRLGGHPLAVEVVGVYLWQVPEISYGGYLMRLDEEGLEALEGVALEENLELSRNQQAVLSELMLPTLATLSPIEALALEYAALLPPVRIALPWLKALAGKGDPKMATTPKPGYPDPWKQVERRLLGLRLLTEGEDLRLGQMQRLSQDVVLARMLPATRDERRRELMDHAQQRARHLKENWLERDNRWEAAPLHDFTLALIAAGSNIEAPNAEAFEAGAMLANWTSDALIPLGRYHEGRDLLRRAVEAQDAAPAPNETILVELLSNLGLIEQMLGDTDAARELLQRAVELQAKVLDPDHPQTAVALGNLALVEEELGHLEAARELLQKAIAIEEKVLSPDDTTLAVSYSNLASVEQAAGHLEAARELLQKAIAIEEKAYGAEHPHLAIRYSNLATLEQAAGHLEAARELLQKAIAIEEKVLDDDHPNLAVGYSNLATVERDLGHLEAARELLLKAIKIQKQSLGEEHPALGVRYSNLGQVEQGLGDFEAARTLLREALAIFEKAFAPDHPALAVVTANLAMVERDLGHLDEARLLMRRAVELDEAALEADSADLAISYFKLAVVEYSGGDPAAARDYVQRAVGIQAAALDDEHPRLAQSRFLLAQLAWDEDHTIAARDMAQSAYNAQQSRLGAEHPDTIKTALWLAEHEVEHEAEAIEPAAVDAPPQPAEEVAQLSLF